jgi:type VII secretion-associated serine protease mycosin
LRGQVPEIDHDHVYVRLRSRPHDLAARLARAGARIEGAIGRTVWTALATKGDAVAVKARLEREPTVAQVTLSYIRHALTVPNDPRWNSAQRDYLSPLRMDRAWDVSKGAGVKVAVVDTGVDTQHPDLSGRIGVGTNIVPSTNSVQDDSGHGTMVAGVIAANLNNGRGGAGIAPQAQILPVKVLDAGGAGTDGDIADGITWAADHGAKVINLSLGGPGGGDVLCAAVNTALAADAVVVAAAGNDGAESVGYPAACPGVIAVSATTHTGALTAFSSYGWRVDIAAPGLDITSTSLSQPPTSDSYATESGTSFSTPIVAGVAALVRAHDTGASQAEVVQQILSTARDVGPPSVDRAFGHGIVDPLAALGRPALAPRVALSAGTSEPNDTAATATALAVGTTRSAQIAPETDEDWYRTTLGTGWYKVRVPSGSGALDHDMQPVVQLYDASKRFLMSQEFAGGDLVFNIDTAGDYFVRVTNRGGDTAPYQVTVSSMTTAPALYGAPLAIDLLSAAQSVGVGDLDGDGRKDIAFLMGDTSSLGDTLVVLSQTAARSFNIGDVLATPAGTSGGGLAVGDINGDGKADVAFPTSNFVEIFLQGSQGLDLETSIAASGVSQLAIGDIDEDGHPDVVTAGPGPSGVKVYWGPSFSPQDRTNVTASTTTAISIGDFSGDGHLDLATIRGGIVAAFSRSVARSFTGRQAFALTNPSNVAVDPSTGHIVVTQRQTPGKVVVLSDDGSLLHPVGSAITLQTGRPEPVAIADLDGGGSDIAVLHDDSGDLEVVRAGGTIKERFFADDQPSSHYDARALAVDDIDGDGHPDVIVGTKFGISLLMHRADSLPATYGTHLVAGVSPAPRETGVAGGVHPTLSLTANATNASSTVKLVDARGDTVPATISGNGTTTITVSPTAALANGAYALRVDGLSDGSGDTVDGYATPFIVGPTPDQTAPDVTFGAAPSGYRTTAGVSIGFSSHDGGATFECSRDSAPYTPCSSPVPPFNVSAGAHKFRVIARDAAGNESAPAAATWTFRPPPHGYWMVGGGGKIYPFGTAPPLGSAPSTLAADIEVSPSGYGYWVVDMLGRVYAFGDAQRYGNATSLWANEVVTSISRTVTGKGYWLFTSRGRVMSFGDAHFYGDLRSKTLNGPVLDSVRTPSGRGYYMVGSDGGVFTFGDAKFYGSTGGRRVSAPIRTLVPDPDRVGYWLVGRDGAVYPFQAASHGSMAGKPLNKPVVGMVSFGNGYLMVAADGGIFNFSSKPFYGSLGGNPPSLPIVAVAAYG